MQPFPNPNGASYKIWSTLADWPQRYSSFIWNMTERQNHRMTELQNHGIPEGQGKSSWAPTFSKWGYKNIICLVQVTAWKQVAHKATIAHLSPMCQGQISFQKTYKWAMETRGPKSNSSELLCLSWLPATLMMIRSKMNELAWRHHFPIISLWEIL